MKKIIVFISAILLNGVILTAKQPRMEKSEPFDEPDYGWNKLLQLKNGNTFYFHSTKKEGIEVTVYNKQRKQIAEKTLEGNLWEVRKMRASKIQGLYEINGEPVLFIMQYADHEAVLYRIRINPSTAAIVKEEKIGSLSEISARSYAAMLGVTEFGDIAESGNIIVEKDPNSDCYVAIFFEGTNSDNGQHIKIVHYDGKHAIINTALYDAPEGKFKSFKYIGAAVDGNKRLYLATYSYNAKAKRDLAPKVIVSKLNVGETKFTHTSLNVSDDFNDTKSVMLYNRNVNKLELLTLTTTKPGSTFFWVDAYFDSYKKKKLTGITLLNYIDPETLKLINVVPIAGAKIDAYGSQNIDKDYEFDGVPLNMVLNKDNTTTILMEEVSNSVENSGTRDPMGQKSMGHVSIKSQLGSIGISELSDTGAELRGYAINKRQLADGTLPVLYMSGRSKGIFTYPMIATTRTNDNQFLSYDYINGNNSRYVIFNDLPRNADKDEQEEKRKLVSSASSTNTMCYKLNDQKMDKFYLFGEPDGKHVSTYCYIESSDYNKDSNTYATMIVEHDGRDRQVRVVWINFD